MALGRICAKRFRAMIKFLTEEVRMRFHELPVDRQREFQDLAERQIVTILFVEYDGESSEVSVRIDEKLNHIGSGV